MALDFLNDSPERAYRKAEADLRLFNPSLDMRRFRTMCSTELDEEIDYSALPEEVLALIGRR